ncbi:hypothetical protein Pfo_008483 [Paulownia fortunei]|nr:hypothetical protein Pfo_008483 [Paulownia fortunei]
MRISSYGKKHNTVGAWTKQEDQKLIDYIKIHGEGCWSTLPKAAGLQRCGKSCRLRWMNYLRPDIKRGNFCIYEEDLIIKLHALLGNRWSLIAGRLPGRTDNEVKNYWNSHIKRKLKSVGIDPKNHRVDQTLLTSCTTCKNHQPNNIYKDTKSSVSRKDPSKYLSKSLSNDQSSDSTSSIGDDDEAVSSTDLNLDLIAVPSSSSSSPSNFTVVEKKQEVGDELRADIEAQNQEKPALLLFM